MGPDDICKSPSGTNTNAHRAANLKHGGLPYQSQDHLQYDPYGVDPVARTKELFSGPLAGNDLGWLIIELRWC